MTCGFVYFGEVRSRAASKMHMCFSFCNTMKLSNCASVLSLQVFDLLIASQNYVDKFELFLRKKSTYIGLIKLRGLDCTSTVSVLSVIRLSLHGRVFVNRKLSDEGP